MEFECLDERIEREEWRVAVCVFDQEGEICLNVPMPIQQEAISQSLFRTELASLSPHPLLITRESSTVGFVSPLSNRLHSLSFRTYQRGIYRLALDLQPLFTRTYRFKKYVDAGVEVQYRQSQPYMGDLVLPSRESKFNFIEEEFSAALPFIVQVADCFDGIGELPAPPFGIDEDGTLESLYYVWSLKARELVEKRESPRSA